MESRSFWFDIGRTSKSWLSIVTGVRIIQTVHSSEGVKTAKTDFAEGVARSETRRCILIGDPVDPRREFIQDNALATIPPSTFARTYVPTTDLALKTGNWTSSSIPWNQSYAWDSFFLTLLVAFRLILHERMKVMAGWRQAIELAIGEEDLAALRAIARSRTEPASRVERARMLLAYRGNPSFFW
jgi:hypothetical protein